ncbi:MAG: O-antigen ligase family protein [Uliginosibacterium sp.]|nr:O-antigen ligase family protein [Uliginosibacterium sp.]
MPEWRRLSLARRLAEYRRLPRAGHLGPVAQPRACGAAVRWPCWWWPGCRSSHNSWVSYGNLLAVFGITSSLARASDAGSNGQRLYDWHAAWLAIQASPWWGEGPGSFYKLSIDAMAKTGQAHFSKFAEHAHNLPLQLAAEYGVPVALLAVGGMFGWYLKHLLRKPSPLSLWGLSCVAVTGLHSLVEYPLWYNLFP